MRRFRRFELIEDPCFFIKETSIIPPKTLTFPPFINEEFLNVSLDLDPFNFNRFSLPSPFDFFVDEYDVVSDLVRIDHHRTPLVKRLVGNELYLQSLSDRVAELESRFDRLVRPRRIDGGGDRKYTWTAEIKGQEEEGFDRKYKWVAEIVEEAKRKEEEKKKKKCGVARNVKWTAEIKGKGENSGSSRKYTFEVECGDHSKKEKKEEKKKKGEKEHKKKNELRIVEIEEPNEEGAVILRQVW